MKLQDARSCYYELSGKLSDVSRQLSLAGIAVIWMFRASSDLGGISFERVLLWPLGFFVTSLGSDLAHYIYGSIAWARFAHSQERRGKKDDDEVFPPDSINWPTLAFFWTKSALTITGYALLLVFIGHKL